MLALEKWRALPWNHDIWELLRFVVSRRSGKDQKLADLKSSGKLWIDKNQSIDVHSDAVDLIFQYISDREAMCQYAESCLRTEDEALAFCENLKVVVGVNAVQVEAYHKSPKAMVASVTGVTARFCAERGMAFNPSPQERMVWAVRQSLHVTARNLDGCIEGILNPRIVWEIKEYWGQTNGGSKMSDAVYECHLVGRELVEFREKNSLDIKHVVMLDGRQQWGARRSDLLRFIDLLNQGFIDCLIVGREVETHWRQYLESIYGGPDDVEKAKKAVSILDLPADR
jgi:hypothetical protein